MKIMNIKNYTSTVSPLRSISRIESELQKIGVTHIAELYDNGNVTGIVFQINHNGMPLTFKLAARTQAIEALMLSGFKRMRKDTDARVKDQSRRTAWKIVSDSVAVKVAEIMIEGRNTIEAFLSSVYNMQKDQTLFEQIEAGKFKALKSGE